MKVNKTVINSELTLDDLSKIRTELLKNRMERRLNRKWAEVEELSELIEKITHADVQE